MSNIPTFNTLERLKILRVEYLANLTGILLNASESSPAGQYSHLKVFVGRELWEALLDAPGQYSHLKVVHINECPQLMKLFTSNLMSELKNLEKIEVRNCHAMEELIAVERSPKEFFLPKLKRLSLVDMPKLKSICSSNGVMVCESLQVIDIWNCSRLKKILSSSSKLQLGVLKNLEEITAVFCDEMEEIIAIDDVDCKKELIISLPKLRKLTLKDMQELKSIINVCGSNGVILVCDSLQVIDIQGCRKLKKILSSSSKLQLGVLKNLEEIDVRGCIEMEEIIAIDDVDCKKELIISLPKLRKLTLLRMRELKSIINVCGSNRVLMVCDSLQEIVIWGCPQLKRLPIYVGVDEKGEPSPPPALKKIDVIRGWWEALEWDHLHPSAKTILLPFCEFD
ncbi:hypothetical protein Dsin_023443 [Dipteronia sinensis]|uniref:Disease resistance protein At4g27190-like leucine-rich repeats domain-containing protein n=1 Tax=Dipteronia sinensis TaxID=43782 RepID=A0AAE0A3M7_9ROSI|nr:hypothetical protein Dsin_023443 [Dipteronia sinensis]